jgi:hypothetical protein
MAHVLRTMFSLVVWGDADVLRDFRHSALMKMAHNLVVDLKSRRAAEVMQGLGFEECCGSV